MDTGGKNRIIRPSCDGANITHNYWKLFSLGCWVCEFASCFLFFIGFCLFAAVINLRGPGPGPVRLNTGKTKINFQNCHLLRIAPPSLVADIWIYFCVYTKYSHQNETTIIISMNYGCRSPCWGEAPLLKYLYCRIEEEYLRGHESWKVALMILSAGLELSRQLGILPSNMCRCWGAALGQIEPLTMMFTTRQGILHGTTTATASNPAPESNDI